MEHQRSCDNKRNQLSGSSLLCLSLWASLVLETKTGQHEQMCAKTGQYEQMCTSFSAYNCDDVELAERQ